MNKSDILDRKAITAYSKFCKHVLACKICKSALDKGYCPTGKKMHRIFIDAEKEFLGEASKGLK